MADWRGVQAGLESGYALGRSTGGRMSGIGLAVKNVADGLKKQQELNQAEQTQMNVLGREYALKSILAQQDPDYQLKKALADKISGKTSSNGSSPENDLLIRGLISKETGVPFEMMMTDEEKNKSSEQKAKEQAMVATEKEKQLNASKVGRLSDLANVVERKFKETTPHSGIWGPISGSVDLALSNLQATKNQVNDTAYRSFVKGFRAQLARALGDVGNLSEPEQKAAMNLVPNMLDSRETASKKLSNLRDLISTIQSRTGSKESNTQSASSNYSSLWS